MAEEYELADALHEATTHRDLAERCRLIEEELGMHRGRLDGLDLALAAHAEEPIELVEVEVEDSDGAQVDVEQAEADAEPGGDASADAGEEERAG